MIASDIMTEKPLSLNVAIELEKAVEVMLENDISIAPVIGHDGNILGQVSEVTVLKAFILSQSTPDKVRLLDYKQFLIPPDFVHLEDSIDVVVKVLLKSNYNRVLVVNKSKKLCGIISPKDLIRKMMGQKKRGSLLQELHKMQTQVSNLKVELESKDTKIGNYEKLIQGSDFMMHASDKNGIILVANKKLHQTLGYAPGTLVGQSIYKLYDKFHHIDVEKSLKQLQEKGDLVKSYSTFLTSGGAQIRVEVASSVLKSDKGEFIATSTISRMVDPDDILRALHRIYTTESSLPGHSSKK